MNGNRQRKSFFQENRLMGLVFAVLSASMFGVSFRYSEDSTLYVRFILGIFFFLSVILFFTKIESTKRITDIFTIKRIMALCTIILYTLAIPLVGFFVSTFLFTFLFMFQYNHEGILRYLIIATIGTLIFFLVFKLWLGVWFPQGILF